MKITLDDGTEIKGTADEVGQLLKGIKMGDSTVMTSLGYHYSTTKDKWVKVADMDTMHIRNSMVKASVDWLADFREGHRRLNDQEFVETFIEGTTGNAIGLFIELCSRL